MAEIGIGTRVFVGWVNRVQGGKETARLKTGTIKDGPFEPGLYTTVTGNIVKSDEMAWTVQMDYGDTVTAYESILTPIDGDEGLNDEPTMSEIPKEVN